MPSSCLLSGAHPPRATPSDNQLGQRSCDDFAMTFGRCTPDISSTPLIQIKPGLTLAKRLITRGFARLEDVTMNRINTGRMLLVGAVLGFGIAGSIGWSQDEGITLSIQSAEARVGRPLTPVSVAGVARRTTRRAVVGGAAVGAAAAGAACVRVLVNGRYVCR
jgi:hypothetical protein